MATVYSQRELAHYGVKGMRWGVRRTRAQLDAAHPDATAAATLRGKASANKSTNVLSNAELQTVITRMNLEQNYARLIAGPPKKSKIKKGMEVVDTVLSIGDKGLKAHKTGTKVKALFDELNIERQRKLNPAIAALPPVKVKHGDILHHGVKGMRWGVRKDRAVDTAQNIGVSAAAGTTALMTMKALHRATHTRAGFAVGNKLLGPGGGLFLAKLTESPTARALIAAGSARVGYEASKKRQERKK